MISFVSIFLGLVVGPQPVELLVQPEVAMVELLLDGAQVGRLAQPPWSAVVNFGERLAPHRLEAVARDATGQELGRVVQWINVPRAPAEVKMVMALSPDGRGSRVRLLWKSVTDAQPSKVALWLDGLPLEVSDPQFFELPDYDPDQLHFVRAELEFSANVVAVTEATFGGRYADEVSTELTAVPVGLRQRELPSRSEIEPLLTVKGERARVVATDKGPAEVVLVRDVATERPLRAMSRGVSYAFAPQLGRAFGLVLAKDQWLRIFWTIPEVRRQDDSTYVLFPRSQDFGAEDGDFYYHLTQARWPTFERSKQQLVDAVAVAGMSASERNRRRAVVVVLHNPFEDRSQLAPEQVRHYLALLRVPLRVWTTRPKPWRRNGGGGWGEVRDVSTLYKLASAILELRQLLESQRIVWIDGVHLPPEVVVSSSAALEPLP